MKKLLLWIIAILAGEFLVMKKKDANFKKQLTKKQGVEKLTYVFDRLFSFNKDLINETKESIQTLDKEEVAETVKRTKARVQAEYTTLKESMNDVEGGLATMSKEKIKNIVTGLEPRITQLQTTVKDLGVDLDKKYAWKEKRSELKKLYENIEKKA